MRKIATILCILFCAVHGLAQNYSPVDGASSIKFNIKNLGLNVTGSFKGLKGKINFDPLNLAAAVFTVSVDASTVNTANSSRDKHLKKEDYFDVANYPELSFASTKITGSAGTFMMEGNLTIKGVSKQIAFPFTAKQEGNGYRFTGQFNINRRHFNVGGSSWILSDELIVSLNVSTIKE
jgi:polyisoprenoid-binding protein YceI